MNSADRVEFERQLAVLCAGMDVPCTEERKEAYWKGLQAMSLAMFARTVEHMLAEEEWTRIPKPAQIWQASRRLRAPGPTPRKDDGWRGDQWDVIANQRLRKHITLQALAGIHYASKHDRNVLRRDAKWKPTLETEQLTGILVAYKKAWAQDMREWGEVLPTLQEQQKAWDGCMQRADAEINQIRRMFEGKAA